MGQHAYHLAKPSHGVIAALGTTTAVAAPGVSVCEKMASVKSLVQKLNELLTNAESILQKLHSAVIRP